MGCNSPNGLLECLDLLYTTLAQCEAAIAPAGDPIVARWGPPPVRDENSYMFYGTMDFVMVVPPNQPFDENPQMIGDGIMGMWPGEMISDIAQAIDGDPRRISIGAVRGVGEPESQPWPIYVTMNFEIFFDSSAAGNAMVSKLTPGNAGVTEI